LSSFFPKKSKLSEIFKDKGIKSQVSRWKSKQESGGLFCFLFVKKELAADLLV